MWTLANGQVVIDRPHSHIHGSEVLDFLPEAIRRIDPAGRQFLVEEVDFGQVVGSTICVATRPGDQIVFAKRPRRAGHTRFVKNRQPEACSSVVVILKRSHPLDQHDYVLITAFIGKRSHPEPWDRNAKKEAWEYWNSHALIWGCEPVIPETLTKVCPW